MWVPCISKLDTTISGAIANIPKLHSHVPWHHSRCILVFSLTIKQSPVTWRKRCEKFVGKKCQSKAQQIWNNVCRRTIHSNAPNCFLMFKNSLNCFCCLRCTVQCRMRIIKVHYTIAEYIKEKKIVNHYYFSDNLLQKLLMKTALTPFPFLYFFCDWRLPLSSRCLLDLPCWGEVTWTSVQCETGGKP